MQHTSPQAIPEDAPRAMLEDAPRAMLEDAPRAMPEEAPRAMHDLGGVSKFMCEPVDTEHHALSAFDREVDALRQLLSAQGLMTVDELRRGIEAIPEADYHRMTYYQKWIRSITSVLMNRGVLTEGEIAAALERL